MTNLREEILKLTNPAPIFKDPEDNSDDETSAKVVDQSVDGTDEITQPSRLRQKTALILSETDKRYAGKRTSRKKLNSDTSDSGNDWADAGDGFDDDASGDNSENEIDVNEMYGFDDDDDDIEEDDDNDEDAKTKLMEKDFKKKFGTEEFTFKDDGDYSKYADDDDDDVDEDDSEGVVSDGDDDSDDEDDDSDDEDEENGQEDEDDGDSEGEGIQKFSQAASDEVAKGQAAKLQLGLWDTLLEGRIKLQKALSIVNQLPQTDTWTDYTESSDSFIKEASEAQTAVEHLLSSLVHLQDLLIHQNIETTFMLDKNAADTKGKQKPKKPVDDDDDEEIPSDSDVEMEPQNQTEVRKRKLTIDEYPGFLKKRHDGFKDYRNATIQKWYDKTRLAAGKMTGKSFSAFDQSAVIQINQILADKERLVKRTQLKRTMYRVLGTNPETDELDLDPDAQQGDERVKGKDLSKDHDEEIFDDDDFYHQLLRELIERKTSDVNDPIALSRQWLEIQKLRSKNKKKVDTKASKGRKVRYDVHKKLTNFMAPFDNCEWSHEARDDLFKSLFGKRFATKTA